MITHTLLAVSLTMIGLTAFSLLRTAPKTDIGHTMYSVEYYAILNKLTEITNRAIGCRTVAEVDDCIEDYRAILMGKDDEAGGLAAMFEYRNSIVSSNNCKEATK